MYKVQQAVIELLETNKSYYVPGVKTIKEYAGELKDLIKLNAEIPAVYVMTMDSMPIKNTPEHQVDLLIVTKSDVFDKQTNKNINVQLAQQAVDLIEAQPGWTSGGFDYLIDTERVNVKLAMLDNKYAIVIIHLYITEGMDG